MITPVLCRRELIYQNVVMFATERAHVHARISIGKREGVDDKIPI